MGASSSNVERLFKGTVNEGGADHSERTSQLVVYPLSFEAICRSERNCLRKINVSAQRVSCRLCQRFTQAGVGKGDVREIF
jgi:hypothetical protein